MATLGVGVNQERNFGEEARFGFGEKEREIEGEGELIQKLNKKGRQLDAVKFIYALKEVEKYPPVPLLKAYITEAKKIAKEVREKGNHSARAQNEATAKELGALKSVLKAVEEYKLENEYPRVGLVKRITQLEHKKAEKKRSVIATATAAAKSQQQEQQSKKRPRLSPTTSAAVMTANPYHRHHHHQHPPMIHTQPQLGLADRAPYIGVPSSYDLASSSAYVHSHGIGAPSLGGSMLDHGRTRSPPPTSYYSSQSLQGTSSLYDRPMTYNGYVPGLPPSYGSSLYP
ncbi:uncharacterized protein A4U43_C08F22480 [Asparagus officinalis]|nr:uncharacterized protein A4U43_C08F22480 [Asparagus officinalis]